MGALDEQSRSGAEQLLAQGAVPDAMRRVIGARSAAEGLHELAEDTHASLLAVGVTHRGTLGRLVPGSVGEHLLHGAPCPVAVVPGDFTEGPVRTVGVAYANSEESAAALRAGEDLARRFGARLIVITVLDPSLSFAAAPGIPYVTGDLLAELEQRLKLDTQQVVDALASELDTDVRFLVGPAGKTLVDACQDDVDLLVTASRGYGPANSVLLGSVSRHLVDHAPCPVVVVPRDAPAEEVPEPAEATA